METERLDPSRRSARMVSMGLRLLHGPPHARRGPPADQALEGYPPSRPPGSETLRARRPALLPPTAAGAAALGLLQPHNLIRFHSAATSRARGAWFRRRAI